MRIIANENVMATAIAELRARGHDVISVKESMRSAPDQAILTRVQSEKRILVTFDKDFGELAFRWGLSSECGVILFRLAGSNPDEDSRRVVTVIESRDDWPGHLSVVTEDRVRMRSLPASRP